MLLLHYIHVRLAEMTVKSDDQAPSALNVRIKSGQRELIERAAKELDRSVSEFVRDAAVKEARHALMDRTTFQVDDETWQRFTDALDAPTKDNPRLRDLMSRKPVWED